MQRNQCFTLGRGRSSRRLMCAGLLVCCGCAGEPGADEDTSTAALTAPVRLIDAPSPQAIMMHWSSARDGRQALASLDFTVENTSDAMLDVELRAESRAGQMASSRTLARVRINPRSSVSHSLPIAQLGVQLVGSSASTQIAAVYKGPDGADRVSLLPSVWVTHEPGFARGYARGAIEEARANAAGGLAKVREARPVSGRVFDARAQRFADINPADAALGQTRLVTQLPGMPDMREIQAWSASAVHSDDGLANLDDADRGQAAAAETGAFEKAGNYKVCFQLPYWFLDASFGEDYLQFSVGREAYEPARYMAAFITDWNGAIIWAGNLDTLGCSPSRFHANTPAGKYYTGFVTTSIYRAGNDMHIDVFPTSAEEFPWGAQNYTINGAGGTMTLVMTGAWSAPNAAVAAANTVYRNTTFYPNTSSLTKIITDEDCPGIPGSGCASGNTIFLGLNHDNISYAAYKYVVAHELGHRVQGLLYGLQPNPYTTDTQVAACRCDHVQNSNDLHCLQSREDINSAQVEGFGQFFASDAHNIGSDANCTMVYYKEFRNDNGTITQPPLAKSCFSQVKWMRNHCTGNDRGTEYDWMNFYWRIHNKDNYAATDLKSVYSRACGGGSCDGVSTPWVPLSSAAQAVFGVGSPKATAWTNQGNNFGVNQ